MYFNSAPPVPYAAGLHQYDALIKEYSRAGNRGKSCGAACELEKRVEAVDAAGLHETHAADRELVLTNIQGALLTEEVIRPWDFFRYLFGAGSAGRRLYVIIMRKHAPADERLKSVVTAKERKCLQVFAAARENLKNPRRILHGDNSTGAAAGRSQLLPEQRASSICPAPVNPQVKSGLRKIKSSR